MFLRDAANVVAENLHAWRSSLSRTIKIKNNQEKKPMNDIYSACNKVSNIYSQWDKVDGNR